MMEINAQTQLCALLGNPVDHSLSPAIHNAAFRRLGLNFVYLAFPVQNIEGALQGLRALGHVRGFSVTIPHKVAVLPLLDSVETTAKLIGSVNTIVKDRGLYVGSNTDASGALQALQEGGVELSGRRVLILGSGGAARAIAFGLGREGKISHLTLLSIDEKERKALAGDFRMHLSLPVEEAPLNQASLQSSLDQAHLVIHCTPVGMHPNIGESCVPQHLLHHDLTVMDIVYNPIRTRLIQDAESAGCRTIHGIEMFLHQAVGQFELWTGEPAPVDVMRAVLTSHFQ